VVFRPEQQKTQLIRIDKEGDGLEVVVLLISEGPYHNVLPLDLVRFLIVKPLLHQLWRGFETFSLIQSTSEIITGREFNTANPVAAAPATGIILGYADTFAL